MVIDQTLSNFDQMQFQAEVLLELDHILMTKKIPNALLLSGNLNTGRKEAAFWFAKGANCQNSAGQACGNCISCRKIDAKTHPDMLTIELVKGKKAISISQIRQLGTVISSRPNEAYYRMVLILDAHLMNVQAQNALLKMLEEPPEKTFFVLIANNVTLLLPTIISRCRSIRFLPLTFQQIKNILVDEYKADPLLAGIAAKTWDADVKKAKTWLNLNPQEHTIDWIARRKWLIASLLDITLPQDKQDKTSIQKGLLLSSKLSLEPDLLEDMMAIIKTFLRDLAVSFHHPQKIVNLDFFDSFTDISKTLSQKKIFKWMDSLFETERKLTSNCTIRLTLDSFFLQIAQT
ncbi:MAG: DNA polymerase III subunit delta' [Desulfobacula sp.]|nr:DNA polymerase III subunit delta' [Desulfobacula sp.]